ncbi:CHRD domain-containing protein [Altererythrobacter salegens]|uniref:CHRD domain-containing protein n=1 Tax=Croceibacterium salegens TaxID=1737568 RepID=A0A6I4SUU8_9SPHN|nr:CHRD domain-containing protein [Croceibacterium salegens]MXO59775.1 CHRD domain-containing protein [Croceibacterium salegens]
MTKTILAVVVFAGAASLAACASLEEEAVGATSKTYHAVMLGSNEVGGGDPDGSGRAEVSIGKAFDQVCYELNDLNGLDTVTAVHIHFGKAGVNGAPVLTLTQSNQGRWQGCKNGSEWAQNRLQGNPQDFYVNVHTTAFPGGAIRGQLVD